MLRSVSFWSVFDPATAETSHKLYTTTAMHETGVFFSRDTYWP